MLYRISVTERGLTGIANIFRSRLSRLDDLLGAGTVPLKLHHPDANHVPHCLPSRLLPLPTPLPCRLLPGCLPCAVTPNEAFTFSKHSSPAGRF